MSGNADFILTIGGRDMTGFCLEWEFDDDSKKMSRLSATIGNPDQRNSGCANCGDMIAIRFGHDGRLDEQAEFKIREIDEDYPTQGELTISVAGYDDQAELTGGKCQGNFPPGSSPKDVMENIADAYGLKLEGSPDGPKSEDNPISVYNEKPRDIIYRMQRMCQPGKGGKAPKTSMSASGKKPSNFKGKTWDEGDVFSGAGPQSMKSEDGRQADENRAANNANSAAGDQITGGLELFRYPIRAKRTVTVVGVGPKASGEYFVEHANHKWSKGSGGILSNAALVRGGTGKGGAGGATPMVCHAGEKKGTLYIGPRKLDGGSQATFRFGDGKHLIHFTFSEHEQQQRGGGESGTGKACGVDLRRKGEAYESSADSGGGEGGGD